MKDDHRHYLVRETEKMISCKRSGIGMTNGMAMAHLSRRNMENELQKMYTPC